MEFFETYGKEIVALMAPVIAWMLNSFFKGKAKLQVGIPHQFKFIVQQPLFDAQGNQVSPTQTVHTSSFIIQNSGRETATNVELVFNWEPMCLNLWPVRHYVSHTEPDRRYVLIFDSLAPREFIGIEVLSVNGDLPNLVTVRSAQCTAQFIDMYPQPIVKQGLRFLAVALMTVGLAASVYLAIVLVQFLVLRTPLG